MNTLRFAASERLELQQADHDVAIQGWDQEAIELTVDGATDQVAASQQDDALVVEAHAPLAINIPRGTAVTVGQVSGDLLLRDLDRVIDVGTVHGDASVRSGHATVTLNEVHGDLAIEHLSGPLSVSETHGDVHLSQVGAANLGQVHGSINARTVAADLRMGVVQGDVRARDVAGLLTLESGQSDFSGRVLAGGMNVHNVQGNLSLKTALTPGLTYSGRASGDIVARFPEGTSALLNLEAEGQISAKGLEIEERDGGQMVARAGEGEAQVALRAGGHLSVRVRAEDEGQPWGFSMDELSAQINAEIAQHIGNLADGIPDFAALASREVEKAMRQVEREIQKAQRQAERAARRAEEHARSAEERARRAQERAQRKARQFQAKFERRWGPPDAGFGAQAHTPHGSSRARPQVSREEQLAVLKMLQEGKISAEEAETLLKALEA